MRATTASLRPGRAGGWCARSGWATWALVGLIAVIGRPAAAQREPGWDLRVADRIEVAAGATAVLTIALAVDRGLTVSKAADVIIDLELQPGLAVKKRRLGRSDAVDPEADAPRFAINLRAEAPGDHTVRLHARFWLCRSKTCRPIDVQRTTTITVSG